MNGTKLTERELHVRFSSYWSHGEWFKPALELLSFISALPVSADAGWMQEVLYPPWVNPVKGKNRRPEQSNPRELIRPIDSLSLADYQRRL